MQSLDTISASQWRTICVIFRFWVHEDSAKLLHPLMRTALYIFAVANSVANPMVYGFYHSQLCQRMDVSPINRFTSVTDVPISKHMEWVKKTPFRLWGGWMACCVQWRIYPWYQRVNRGIYPVCCNWGTGYTFHLLLCRQNKSLSLYFLLNQ